MGHGPPEQSEMPKPPGGQRDGDGKGDAIAKTEKRAETRGCNDAADGGADRSPSERRHHQRQWRQVKQQQRDQRARNDRGKHQGRRRAGRYGNKNDRDHQLSRSFRAVRGFLRTPTIGNRTTREPYEDFRSAARMPPTEDFTGSRKAADRGNASA